MVKREERERENRILDKLSTLWLLRCLSAGVE